MLAAARRNSQRWPGDDFPHSIMRTGSDSFRFTDDACELARVSANDLQVRLTQQVMALHAGNGLQQPSHSIASPIQPRE